jgi:hypothetical protein
MPRTGNIENYLNPPTMRLYNSAHGFLVLFFLRLYRICHCSVYRWLVLQCGGAGYVGNLGAIW